jgi:hypothetical protein
VQLGSFQDKGDMEGLMLIAILIEQGMSQSDRLIELRKLVSRQLRSLEELEPPFINALE